MGNYFNRKETEESKETEVVKTINDLPIEMVEYILLSLEPKHRGVAACVCRLWYDIVVPPGGHVVLYQSIFDKTSHNFLWWGLYYKNK